MRCLPQAFLLVSKPNFHTQHIVNSLVASFRAKVMTWAKVSRANLTEKLLSMWDAILISIYHCKAMALLK